jgi:GR25 family glycosyltransferase involved in LPS biosynthesis
VEILSAQKNNNFSTLVCVWGKSSCLPTVGRIYSVFVLFFLTVLSTALSEERVPEASKSSLKQYFKPCANKTACVSVPGIDYVYLINLDRRPDRLERSLNQLLKYGIIPYRFSAVDAQALPASTINAIGLQFQKRMKTGYWVTHFSQNGKPEYDFLRKQCYGNTYFSRWMKRGAIGCTLSHLSVLQDAYDSGYKTIWVLEDDISVKESPTLLSSYIQELDALVGPSNWDIFFTDKTGILALPSSQPMQEKDFWYLFRPDLPRPDLETLNEKKALGSHFIKTNVRIRTHSMVIRRSGMKKILVFENLHHIFLPYDNELAYVPSLMQYNLTYNLITYFEENDSDIQGKE